jgi:hypothetical protein
MERYSGFVKYLVLFLAVLHAMVGEVSCHAHTPQMLQHAEHHTEGCCSDNPHDEDEQPCECEELPVIRETLCVDETVKLFSATLSAFVFIVPELYLPVCIGIYNTLTGHLFAQSLRLHLLCGVFLI